MLEYHVQCKGQLGHVETLEDASPNISNSIRLPFALNSVLYFAILLPGTTSDAILNRFIHFIIQRYQIISYACQYIIHVVAKLVFILLQSLSTIQTIGSWLLVRLQVSLHHICSCRRIPFYAAVQTLPLFHSITLT